MNTKTIFLSVAAALAVALVGCGDSSGDTVIDGGGHPDLGNRDLGTDTGTPVDGGTDLGTPVDGGTDLGTPDDGGTDLGVADMGGHYTDAGCYEGTPVLMTDFLNRCTDRSTPVTPRPTPGTRSSLVLPDGGVP